MTRHADFVLRTVEERGVRFVRLWFVDVLGLAKSIAIPVSELESALEDGIGVDGSSLEGSARLAERDVIAHPDPSTFQILPWRPGSLVGRMFCDTRLPDGRPFPGDSREALRRVLSQAADLGFSFQVGAEIEFFLFAGSPGGDPPTPLDAGAYFDLTPQDLGSDFRRRSIEYLEELGIPVKASHHEAAPSQHELDLEHTDALSMADAVITFRIVVKEVARELGHYASFMPQPLEGQPGSGMHLHLSLLQADGANAFHPAGGGGGGAAGGAAAGGAGGAATGGAGGAGAAGAALSPTGRAFLAGILAHGRELSAATNQWVNSYKRLAGGDEAPSHVGWTRHGRAGLVRVPAGRPGRAAAARIELRSPDPACNPYLAFAVVLAAGLRGIERGYELPPEMVDAPPSGAVRLPESLHEATEVFASSELVRDALGDRLCDWYVRNKRREWEEYRRTVTPFERQRYLRL